MAKFDIQKIYIKTKEGITEYTGEPNFASGIKLCTKCNSNMERIPLKTEYIKKDGKIFLVDVDSRTGRMFIANSEPEIIWSCEKCNMATRPTK